MIPRHLAAAALALSLVNVASAQEAMFTESATQPSQDVLYVRQMFGYTALRDDPTPLDREADEWLSHTVVSYGLRSDLALNIEAPIAYRSVDGDSPEAGDEFGVEDILFDLKWRVWRRDSGPINTARLAVIAGVEVPSGTPGMSSHSWDPLLGAALTKVSGRHGYNLAGAYKLNTGTDERPLRVGEGSADLITLDQAYLYRIAPARFDATSGSAWYLVLEANAAYETNGDWELLLAPGLMLEARGYAIEIGVQTPLLQDLDHRPQQDLTIMAGIRLLF